MRTYQDAIENRRSIYAISDDSPLTEEEIEGVVATALVASPSAFNSQSARAVVLFGQQHHKLWAIVSQTLLAHIGPERFAATEAKIDGFSDGFGTVLFFDDEAVTGHFAEEYPSYAQNFPVWAQQANGMLQYNVWNLLEVAGLGASLQHYNPLIDDEVGRTWGLPGSWRLVAQMPFGAITELPSPKDSIPAAERMRSFK